MRKLFLFVGAVLFLLLVFHLKIIFVQADSCICYDGDTCLPGQYEGSGSCAPYFTYCCSPPPTSAPTAPAVGSPTAAPPGSSCPSTQWCMDNVCAGYPTPALCSSVCTQNAQGDYICYTTYDPGEPTPIGGECQVWGPCTEDGVQFCQDPGSSEYQIGCNPTPFPTDGGGGGGGGFPTPTNTPRPPTPTRTPTPTPTVGPGPWVKLKDSSHLSVKSLYNFIPAAPITAYDADDTAQAFYIVGVAGVVGAPSVNITGLNPNAKTGAPEYKANYTPTAYSMSPSNFLLYTQSRKEYEVISALTEITQDGIYVWQGANPLPINDSTKAGFDNYNIVLIVDGQVNVNTAQFAPAKSVAILAQTINFTDVVTEANALFIANDVLTGTTTNLGLKINGNLIAQSSLSNQRQWTDPKKASLFIVFKPSLYLDLLPYLTVVSYEWKQLQ